LHAQIADVGKGAAMVYVSAVVLTVLNLVFWVGILFNMPGTWLMVLVTALLKWWQPGYVRVSWTVVGVAAGLAVLGEVLEFVLGAAGSGPDLEAIVRQLVTSAKAGDVAAAKVLLPYLLGRPPEAVDPDRILQPQVSVAEGIQELPLAAIARALEEVWWQFQAGTVRGVDARLVKELLLGVLQVRQVVEVARKLDAIQAALEARED
jgi:hypothetical protein